VQRKWSAWAQQGARLFDCATGFSFVSQGFRQIGASPEPEPVTLPFNTLVTRIACGRHHVLALTSDGQLLGWGKNDVGQVGVGHGQHDVSIPQVVGGAWNGIRLFDAGRNHSVVASMDDHLWVFGQNVDMQLGITDRGDRLFPTEVGRENKCAANSFLLTTSVCSWSGFEAFGYNRSPAARDRLQC
jgi:alpha-tubulin suppressor-like RCC1 family protein